MSGPDEKREEITEEETTRILSDRIHARDKKRRIAEDRRAKNLPSMYCPCGKRAVVLVTINERSWSVCMIHGAMYAINSETNS